MFKDKNAKLISLPAFEKRFRILPSGVMSKNVIGKRRTAFMRIECIPFAAAIVPSENVIDTMNCDTTKHIKCSHNRMMMSSVENGVKK